MNVRTICLSVLHFGEQTGYDIRKVLTEGPFSYFLDSCPRATSSNPVDRLAACSRSRRSGVTHWRAHS